ncbi:unnamed protein product [Clavelina lepadiformis]|uniref:Uncharacterized protein n=1 Tax=Clavelina lepadiformis TaxID=159417 RepID=A0ABP0F0B3_CLALP
MWRFVLYFVLAVCLLLSDFSLGSRFWPGSVESMRNGLEEENEFEEGQQRTWTFFWNPRQEKVTRYFENLQGGITFNPEVGEPLKVSRYMLDRLHGGHDDGKNVSADRLKFFKVTKNAAVSLSQNNRTCTEVQNYTCLQLVRVPYSAVCTFLFSRRPCTLFRSEYRNASCQRTVQVCCSGYELGTNGYCEKIFVRGDSGCGGPRYIRKSSGLISSPGYPINYNDSLECTWTIQAPKTRYIVFSVMDLDVEDPIGSCDLRRGDCFSNCLYDSLSMRDASTNKTRSLCGQLPPQNEIFYLGSGEVDLTFMSDSSQGGRGFKMAYSIVEGSMLRPRTCHKGQVWKICRRICRLTCEATMSPDFGEWNICIKSDGINSVVDSSAKDDVTCIPGCACPDDKPIWHRGKCQKVEQCSQSIFECGIPLRSSSSTKKILGGSMSRMGAWPWMVQVVEAFVPSCGATLVCSNWVITAAHCFLDKSSWTMPESIDRFKYWFHVGKHWKYDQVDNRRIQSFRAANIIIHPDYNFDTDINDIALVQLAGFVKDFEYARPACLPPLLNFTSEQQMNRSNGHPGVATSCISTGWGITRDIGASSNQLKEVALPIKPGAQCATYHTYDWAKIICAGGRIRQDTCKGDSGGPFMCLNESGKWVLRGITSFGDDCGRGRPGGYTRVSNYMTWIRRYVGSYCGV